MSLVCHCPFLGRNHFTTYLLYHVALGVPFFPGVIVMLHKLLKDSLVAANTMGPG